MRQHFARNTAYSSAAGLIMSIGRFATVIAMARVLGVQETGIAAFALWLVSLVGALTGLGVYTSLTRYLPELKSNSDVRQLTRLLLLPFAGVALLTAVAFATLYLTDIISPADKTKIFGRNVDLLVVLSLYFMQSLATFGLGYLVGRQDFRNLAALALISNLLQLPLVILAGLRWGIDGVLLGYIAGALPFALLCFSQGIGKPRVPGQLQKRLVKFALFSWASTLAYELVWARLEIAFLSHFWGDVAVGLYSVGFTLASLATQAPLLVTGALLPYFAEAISSRQMESAYAMLRTATRLVAFFVLPMSLGMAAVIPELLPLLYGKSFAPGSYAAMILVGGAGLGANIVVPTNFINGMERSDFLFILNTTGAILSLLLSFALVSSMGIMGAALGRASVQVYVVAVSFWFLRYRLGCPLPLTQLGLLFVSALISACVAGLVASQISGLIGVSLSVPVAALVYVLVLRWLRAIPDEDIERLNALFERFPVLIQRGIGLVSRVLSRR
jgi:O-antigen/teichoic acid export membrane protein